MLPSQEQLFQQQGFIILKGIFLKKKLKEIRSLQESIVRYAEKDLEDPFLRWSLKHLADQGVLYDLYQRHPKFLAQTYTLSRTTATYKPFITRAINKIGRILSGYGQQS